MKITKRERYALRMMIDLAESSSAGEPVGVRGIADRQEIAPRYLEHIAASLRKAGLVRSKQGQAGGYLLARAPNRITVGEILAAVGGRAGLVECLEDETACARFAACRSRRMWSLLDNVLRSVLDQYHLDDLVDSRVPSSRGDGRP